MPNESGGTYERIAYVSINKEGQFKVDYVSYVTGEATLQTALGTQIAPLVSGIQKNKDKYLEK